MATGTLIKAQEAQTDSGGGVGEQGPQTTTWERKSEEG